MKEAPTKVRRPLVGFTAASAYLDIRAEMYSVVAAADDEPWRVTVTQESSSPSNTPEFNTVHHSTNYWTVEKYPTEARARARLYALLRALKDVAPNLPIKEIREE